MTLMKLLKKNEDIMKFAVSDTPFFVAKDATLKTFSNIWDETFLVKINNN